MEFEKFKKNIYSQNGEDGIIEEILKRLAKSLDKNFCEFGAWDGIHLSNCYNLIQSQSYKGLFIEGNKKILDTFSKKITDISLRSNSIIL